MAISLVGTASGNAADGGDPSATLPVGTAQNDVVFASYAASIRSDLNCQMITTGYTELADLYADDTEDINLGVFRKVQGVTPDSTAQADCGASTSADSGAIAVMVLRGVNTTTPEDATTTTATAIDDAVPNPPSITTATANAWVIAIGACSEGDASPSAPTNYTDIIEDLGSDSRFANIMMALREITSPGAENPGTFGNISGDSGDCWAAATVAVRPSTARTLAADAGSFAWTGTAANLEFGREVVAAQGSFAWTGAAVTLHKNLPLVAGAGSFTWTGTAASLEHNRLLTAAAGSFVWTGTNVSLEWGREIAAAAGSFVWTGTAATLWLIRPSDVIMTVASPETMAVETAAPLMSVRGTHILVVTNTPEITVH